ncbi:MAG: DegT/DnrJ/EryC1/StrS family aminotransferase [Verrucomicrobiota bacterium]
MKVAFAKPELGEEEVSAAADAIRSGWVTQGPRVSAFEEAFAEYCGAEHAIAVSSCTTGLHLGLIMHGVGEGDEVIVTPHSFIASANAIRYVGARPVFVDIDPKTLNLDAEKIEGLLTERTKAIMAVHQVGRPAPMERLVEIAGRFGLGVIEDAACAIGSELSGERIGGNTWSSLVAFSFHPRKVITTGDGGMLTTDDGEWADRLRRMRQHGMSVNDLERHRSTNVVTERYLELGYNYRMTDIQASIGKVQLERLPGILENRRRLAVVYDNELAGIDGVELFLEPSNERWNYQTYLVRLADRTCRERDEVMQLLRDRGVDTRRGIMSMHREPSYRNDFGEQSFPESERASDQCLALPLFPSMEEVEQEHVVTQLRKVLRE